MRSPPICCVEGCPSKSGHDKEVFLYNFPDKSQYSNLRRRWIDALRLANVVESSWEPKRYSKLCNIHFIGNRWSNDESEPSSVPTIFPTMQIQIAFTPGVSDEDNSLEEVNIVGKPDSNYVVDVDDDEDDYSDDEVIDETSDFLFVIDKKEIESTGKASAKSKGSGSVKGRKKTAVKNTARKAPASRKRKKASKTNGKSAPVTKKVKHVKILAESSDENDDDEGGSDNVLPVDNTTDDEAALATTKDELKVQLGSAPKRVFRRSWSPVVLDKAAEELPRIPTADKTTQVALPGNCEGFIFSTDREDDFNIGVECNIFYDFVKIPELKRRRTPSSRKKIDIAQRGRE